jgi:hypothetical protein
MNGIVVSDKRRRGWFWSRNEIFDLWGEKIGPQGLAVYLCLCRHSDSEGQSRPSLNQISRECGMARRTTINTISTLEGYGLIGVIRTTKQNGENNPNTYELLEFPDNPNQSKCEPDGSAPHAPGSAPGAPQGSAPHAPGSAPGAPMGNPLGKPTSLGKQKTSPTPSNEIELPTWLPAETWAEFVQYRKEIKKPLSELATRKNLKLLDELRSHGEDPVKVIEQSIANGWQGLFAVRKPPSAPRGGPALAPQNAEFIPRSRRNVA